MKTILFFSTVIILLTSTGCLVSEGGWHGLGRGHVHQPAVVVPAAVVVVPAPVIVVPAVRVR